MAQAAAPTESGFGPGVRSGAALPATAFGFCGSCRPGRVRWSIPDKHGCMASQNDLKRYLCQRVSEEAIL